MLQEKRKQIFSHPGSIILSGDCMSKRAVDAVFQGLYLLTDIRGMLRDTAPSHQLTPEQKAETEKIIGKLEKQITIIKEELLA